MKSLRIHLEGVRPGTGRGRKVRPIAVPSGLAVPPSCPPVGLGPDGLIVRFVARGRAVPWSVPTVTRNRGAYKAPALVAWQASVRLQARIAMGGRPPYPLAFGLKVVFIRKVTKGHKTGDRWVSRPDTTNLLKGIEDAMNSVVYVDDSKQCSLQVERFYGPTDEALIEVHAIEERVD